jgi:hypothetical protein
MKIFPAISGWRGELLKARPSHIYFMQRFEAACITVVVLTTFQLFAGVDCGP